MKWKLLTIILIMTALVVGCNPVFEDLPLSEAAESLETFQEDSVNEQNTGMPMRMGPGGGMMARHHAPIPAEYAGIRNPVAANQDSLQRGAELYDTYCMSCHGAGGMGDGPAGKTLDPQPAPIAHTSRMLGDDYMFWRISEGGLHEPFSSAMPRWQDVLDEGDRWDLINYVRALGSGDVAPGKRMGGAVFDPEVEAAKHAEMAAQGVEQGLISQSAADTFLAVHAQLDRMMAEDMVDQSGGMETMQRMMLGQLVADGQISREESVIFSDVHDRLLAAGLME